MLFVYPESRNLQAFSFPLGIIVSNYKRQIEEFQSRNRLLKELVLCLIIGVCLHILGIKYFEPIFSSINALWGCYKALEYILFSAVIILIGHLFYNYLATSYLLFVGSISYELYLTHIQFLKPKLIEDNYLFSSSWYYWYGVLIISIALSLVFKNLNTRLFKSNKTSV